MCHSIFDQEKRLVPLQGSPNQLVGALPLLDLAPDNKYTANYKHY
jgi:hypothetical protein